MRHTLRLAATAAAFVAGTSLIAHAQTGAGTGVGGAAGTPSLSGGAIGNPGYGTLGYGASGYDMRGSLGYGIDSSNTRNPTGDLGAGAGYSSGSSG